MLHIMLHHIQYYWANYTKTMLLWTYLLHGYAKQCFSRNVVGDAGEKLDLIEPVPSGRILSS